MIADCSNLKDGGKVGAPAPLVSVIITTHNRREEVLTAIGSALAQDYRPLEVLVYDDASSDGTVEAIRADYPNVRLFPTETKQSSIILRNKAFRDAKGEFIVSLDDDVYLTDRAIITDIIATLSARPNVAVVAIPFIEPLDTSLHRKKVLRSGEQIAAYTGCAAVLRKSDVLAENGYRECFGQYGSEEGDLAIRLRNRGCELIQGSSGYVVHTKSPKRDRNEQLLHAISSALLFVSLNVPMPYAIWRVSTYWVGVLGYRFSWSTTPFKLKALMRGYRVMFSRLRKRRPVSTMTYRTYKRLPSHGPEPWDGAAPPPCKNLQSTEDSSNTKIS